MNKNRLKPTHTCTHTNSTENVLVQMDYEFTFEQKKEGIRSAFLNAENH